MCNHDGVSVEYKVQPAWAFNIILEKLTYKCLLWKLLATYIVYVNYMHAIC